MKNFIYKHWPILLLIALWVVLFAANYTPKTYLLGWDSLQTELNPMLGVKRAFFSVWQEYQSFGLTAGMGHAADIIRAVTVLLMSFILPQNIIRYTLNIAMILVGAIGTFKLLKLSQEKTHGHTSVVSGQLFPFVGSLFYIFNFFIIQIMALPFESFSIFVGFLPWQIWAFLKVADNKESKKSDWIILAVISILAAGQAVALQLFAVLMIILAVVSVGLIISNRSKIMVKKTLLAGLFILALNGFWILPQVYFLKTGASVVTTSKANQLSTQDILYRNRDKGDLKDFLTNTGFFYDGVDSNNRPIFTDWKPFRATTPVIIVLGILAGTTFLGMFRNSKYRLPFLLAYGVILVALLNNVFPLDAINILIRKAPLINQIFRSPFTKFSIPAALISAYFATQGIELIADTVSRLFRRTNIRTYVKTVVAVVFAAIIMFQAFPVFTGHLFAQNMKVAIPKPYFEAMDYFKTVDKNARIGMLPEYTYWGWYSTNWGYDGSGFLWYGIEQPIISRTFDVWSSQSENYFWELKHAVEAQNPKELINVLQKYDVSYLLLDTSDNPIASSDKAVDDEKLKELLSKTNNVQLIKKWDFIYLYKVTSNKKVANFVFGVDKISNAGPAINVTNFDTIYQESHDYITDPTSNISAYFPFLDLTSQTDKGAGWNLSETDSGYSLTRKLPQNVGNKISEPTKGSTQVTIYSNGQSVGYVLPYTIKIDSGIVSVNFPKVAVDAFKGNTATPKPCISDTGSSLISKNAGSLTVESRGGNYTCFSFKDNNLSQQYGYIVDVKNKNISGQRLYFYTRDATNDQTYLEDRLTKDDQTFVIGQRFDYGLGYSFAFQSNSYSTISSKNVLDSVNVYLMPWDVLKKLSIGDVAAAPAQYSDTLDVKKLNYYLYTVDLNGQKPEYVILDQAYQPGWNAYEIKNSNFLTQTFPFFFGKKLNHVVENNWANAWKLDSSLIINHNSSIIILYWPQYLEYLGIAVLLAIAAYFTLPLKSYLKKLRSKI